MSCLALTSGMRRCPELAWLILLFELIFWEKWGSDHPFGRIRGLARN